MSSKSFLNRAVSNTIASVLSFATQFFQSILVVPFMLSNWGAEKYGVWISIYAFFSLMQLFDGGHQTYVGNEFSRYYNTDPEKARQVLGSGVIVSLGIGLLEMLLTLVILVSDTGSESVIGIPDSFAEPDAKWGVAVLILMWFVSGSIWGLLMKILLPLGMMHRMIYLGLIIRIISTILLILAAVYQWSIFNLAVATAIVWAVYCYAVDYYIYLVLPGFFPWWKGAHWPTGWSNFRRSLVVSSNNFLEQFSLNGLLIVIANFMGPAQIPLFTTMRTVANTALQGAGMVVQPLHADIIRFHANREPHKLEQVFVFNWLLTGSLVNIGFLGLQLVAYPLYQWWTDDKLIFDSSLFNLLIFGVVVANYNRALLIYLSVINHLHSMAYISASRFLLVAGISVGGIQLWGLDALGWSLVVAEIACTGWSLHFAQQQLATIGGQLPQRAMVLSAIPVCLVGGVFIFNSYQPIDLSLYKIAAVMAGVLLALPSYYYLSHYLSSEVKQRFKALLNYGNQH